MKNIYIICFAILLLFHLNSCINSSQNDSKELYALFVGTNDENYDNNKIASAGGGSIEGKVLLFINENPISFFSTGGKVIHLNHWIKNGNNTLYFEGKSQKNIYLKVARMYNNKVSEIILKKIISPKSVKKKYDINLM